MALTRITKFRVAIACYVVAFVSAALIVLGLKVLWAGWFIGMLTGFVFALSAREGRSSPSRDAENQKKTIERLRVMREGKKRSGPDRTPRGVTKTE